MRQVLQTMVYLLKNLSKYVIALLLMMYSIAIIGMIAFANTASQKCHQPEFQEACGSEYSPYDAAANPYPGNYHLMSFDNILYS